MADANVASAPAVELAREIRDELGLNEDEAEWVAALLRPHVCRKELFGRAMVVLKGLSLAVEWELHPSIKKEIDAICADFEAALPSAPGETNMTITHPYPLGKNGKYQCPCCLYMTLSSRNEYEICHVCFWEDDGAVNDEDFGGPNHMTLGEGRENYRRIGACDEEMRKHVRPPELNEMPELLSSGGETKEKP